MYIWNVIRAWFQERIQNMGVDETSFPMFLSAKSFEKVSVRYRRTTAIRPYPIHRTVLELTSNRRSTSGAR